MRGRRLLSVLVLISSLLPAVRAGAEEMRGLWASAWHPGMRNPEQVTRMVAKAKECNFNALFVQVRRRGDVYYRSKIEPMAADVVPGFDPLADVISKAHAEGLEVHAWITLYAIYHDARENTPLPGAVHIEHPDWITKDSRGGTKFPGDSVFLDPGVPEVRAYLLSIAEEIVKDYKVDGLHLDVVKYPSADAGYNEASVARFNAEMKKSGKPGQDDNDWRGWRRAQITELVRSIYKKVKATRPAAKLSAAVYGNKAESYNTCLQDWAEWLKAGILDFAVPMMFVKDNQRFDAQVKESLASAGDGTVYIGQGGWQLSAAQSVEQIKSALTAGAKGIVLYNYALCCDPVLEDKVSLMDTLKQGLYSSSAPIPLASAK